MVPAAKKPQRLKSVPTSVPVSLALLLNALASMPSDTGPMEVLMARPPKSVPPVPLRSAAMRVLRLMNCDWAALKAAFTCVSATSAISWSSAAMVAGGSMPAAPISSRQRSSRSCWPAVSVPRLASAGQAASMACATSSWVSLRPPMLASAPLSANTAGAVASGDVAVTCTAPAELVVTVLLATPAALVMLVPLASVPALVVQVTTAPAIGVPAALLSSTCSGAEATPAPSSWPSPPTMASAPSASTVRLKVTVAVGSSWRVPVMVTGPAVAPAVTPMAALPAASVVLLGADSTALPLATAQLMVTPAAGTPLFRAFTCRVLAYAVLTSAFWLLPPVIARVATKAMLAS